MATTPVTDSTLERYLRPPVQSRITDAAQQTAWAANKWLWLEASALTAGTKNAPVDKDAESYLAVRMIREDVDGNTDRIEVELADGTKRTVPKNASSPHNPPKFDLVEDMAALSHLNEASVLDNLRKRYSANLIYTYSGLFLVAVNPYRRLPIYGDNCVQLFRGAKRNEVPPHVFAVADGAYREMVAQRTNQSILITGESGAGKTENTKKVIQYLTAVASSHNGEVSSGGVLEQQIIEANPILESFGNAQTIRNNNSSRFGKFIRIEFNGAGGISGANIERYLLEKSRVTHQTSKERNYHVFYQFIKGAPQALKHNLLVDGSLQDYAFTKNSNKHIEGVDDAADFAQLQKAFQVMRISEAEQLDFFRIVAAILHLGNLRFTDDNENQAELQNTSTLEQVCHVLGIPVHETSKALLRPVMKAGRDWVAQARTSAQVQYSVEALARACYERMFGRLVERINQAMDTPAAKLTFIGVLDIAGFEIFETNSFEQLCINYTNEKLQQFFNHRMFVLEQEEYKREGIDWKFIDFGLDLQPTIDLIEKTNPIGVLSCLDEDCVMPKATDRTFTEKLSQLWKGKSSKFDLPRFAGDGFILHHYAGKVEYTTRGWLDKNKDPLNENVTRLLAHSSESIVALIFADSQGLESSADNAASVAPGKSSILKKGAFRTVAQRHKEQLLSLMSQLYATDPHFVRCIVPNDEKKAGKIQSHLVLEQLRCNGVLEGIRICRQGYPNRLPFAEFRQRYGILAVDAIPKGFVDGRKAAQLLLEALQLDRQLYRIGNQKVFFRAGVLAELEDTRDAHLSQILTKLQSHCRAYLSRKVHKKTLNQLKAIRVIQRNARIYVTLREWSWWRLYSKVKPLLNVTRVDDTLKAKDEQIAQLEEKLKLENQARLALDERRQQLEAQKKLVEEALNSEKNAAADQQEMLIRTQQRESDLKETLADLEKQLEALEAEKEEWSLKRQQLEKELQNAVASSQQQSQTLERLEKEKTLAQSRIQQLESELQQEQQSSQKLASDRKALEEQLSQLNQQVTAEDAKSTDLLRSKQKLTQQLTELEERLNTEESQRQQQDKKRAQLEAELKQLHEQVATLQYRTQELESSLRKRDQENATLTQQISSELEEKSALDRQKRELTVKLEASESEASSARQEVDKLTKTKRRLEQDLTDLQQLIEVKGDEESKQTELRRLREQELNDLHQQLVSLQAQLEDARKRASQQSEQFSRQTNELQQELNTSNLLRQQQDKKALEQESQIESLESQLARLEKQKKQVESELQSTASDRQEVENSVAVLRQQKEAAEKQLSQLVLQLEEARNLYATAERERSNQSKQLSQLNEEVLSEQTRRQSLEQQKKKAQQDLSELQQQLDESEQQKSELTRRLNNKASEFEQFKEKTVREQEQKISEIEAEKKRLESSLQQQITLCDQQRFALEQLEKTKQRLQAESEDVSLQLEKQQSQLRQSEKALKASEQQRQQWQADCEAERQSKALLEAQVQRIQQQLEQQQLEQQAQQQHNLALSRQKEALEQELKALISEIGDGGKTVHDLEKLKRKLEQDNAELVARLDESELSIQLLQEQKKRLEDQVNAAQKKAEQTLKEKDSQLDDIRRALLRDVAQLGEQLDVSNGKLNELLKQKKKIEQDWNALQQNQDQSTRTQSDLERAKKRTEQQLAQLQTEKDALQRSLSNAEALAQRQEQKANTLSSQLEQLELQSTALDRSKKALEKRVEEQELSLNELEKQKTNLQTEKKKLTEQVELLQDQIGDLESQIQSLKSTSAANASNAQDASQQEKLQILLEETKRAYQAQQRVAAMALEEKSLQYQQLASQKDVWVKEKEQFTLKLESLEAQLNEAASVKRKLEKELSQRQLDSQSERFKTLALIDELDALKQKNEALSLKSEQFEQSSLKWKQSELALTRQLEENEANVQKQLEIIASLQEKANILSRDNEQLLDQLREEQAATAELAAAKQRLKVEFDLDRERQLKDQLEQEQELSQFKQRLSQELKQALAQLNIEQSSTLQWREKALTSATECEHWISLLETEKQARLDAQKQKEKLEFKLNEVNTQFTDLQSTNEILSNQQTTLQAQLRQERYVNEETNMKQMQNEHLRKQQERLLEEWQEKCQSAEKQLLQLTEKWNQLQQTNKSLESEHHDALDKALDLEQKLQLLDQRQSHLQSELQREKQAHGETMTEKRRFETLVHDLQLQLQDQSSKGTASLLERQVKRLEQQLTATNTAKETLEREKSDSVRELRRLERQIKDVQHQIQDKETVHLRDLEEITRLDERLKKLRLRVDELESAETQTETRLRRQDRELEEWKEKNNRLEKEVEKWKSRAMNSNTVAAV